MTDQQINDANTARVKAMAAGKREVVGLLCVATERGPYVAACGFDPKGSPVDRSLQMLACLRLEVERYINSHIEKLARLTNIEESDMRRAYLKTLETSSKAPTFDSFDYLRTLRPDEN